MPGTHSFDPASSHGNWNGPPTVTREARAYPRHSLIVHSDVSGRPLLVAVDRHGPGHEVAYVTEDPRTFFLVIESENLDWSVEVDEGLPGQKVVRDPKD